MAKTFVQLPADGAGKRVGTFDVTAWDGVNLAHLHGMVICDSAGNVVESLAAAPAGTERGVVTRNIPSGTQPVSAASLPLPTGAAADATLTGGTQKTIMRGGAKGTAVAADVTSNPVDANTQALHATLVGTQATVPVTGTFFQATQPVSGPLTDTQLRATAVPVSVPTLTKGTQNAQGLSVQNLKDSGRVAIAINAYQAAGIITTEALLGAAAFTRTADGATATTGNSFTVTAGKRFRIMSITVGTKQTAAALTASKVALRYNGAGGVVGNTSPILAVLDIGTAVATANTYVAPVTIPIGDGFELPGGATFAFTNLASAATVLHTIALLGFEY